MANELFFAPIWIMSLAEPPTFILCLKMDPPLNDSQSIVGLSAASRLMEIKWFMFVKETKNTIGKGIKVENIPTSGSTISQPNPLHQSQNILARMPTRCGSAMRCILSPIRKDRVANIYKYDFVSKQITQITTYTDVDVIRPETDGAQIVYLHDGYLNVLDVESGQSKKLTITIPSDRWSLRSRTINPKDYIHFASISNDGKTLVIEARGDVFTVGTEKGKAVNLSNTSGTREMYPQPSPDGKWVAFFSDRSGEYQLYKQKIDGGDWIPLTTSLDRTNYKLFWSPDGKKILFGNKDFAIFYIDVDSKKLTKIDASNQMKNDEFYWEIADYNWSSDSKWICYSFVQANRNSQIFLYSLEQGKKFAISDDFYDNLNPCFDANGKYLYYLSSQSYDVQMDYYEDNHVLSAPQKVMIVQLHDNEPPPFDETAVEKKPGSEEFHIDLANIRSRITPLPVTAGNYFFPQSRKRLRLLGVRSINLQKTNMKKFSNQKVLRNGISIFLM